MISESYYWKKPLLDMSERLTALKVAAQLSEEQAVQIERDIFIGFYSIRRLFEAAAKVSDSTKALKTTLEWFPNRREVTWLNSHRFDELYDLSSPTRVDKDIVFICGRIIHSFIFAPCLDDHGLGGIFFTSDTDRKSKLYYMRIEDVIRIFNIVGNDYPTSIEWHKGDATGNETLVVK